MDIAFRTAKQKRFLEAYLALDSPGKAAKAVGLSPDYGRHLLQKLRKAGMLPGHGRVGGHEVTDASLTREERMVILSRIIRSPLSPDDVKLKAIDLLNKLCGDYRHMPQQTTTILDLRIGRTTPTPGQIEAEERARARPNEYGRPRQGDE